MTLTGLDPTDPTPGVWRELIFQAGASSGGGTERKVVIFGCRTSVGAGVLDTVYGPVADDSDALSQAGGRSELYHMYKELVTKNPLASVYLLPVTEGAGASAACTLTVANVPDNACTLEVSCAGKIGYVQIAPLDPVNTIATNLGLAINNMDNGQLQATAGVVGPVVTVTCANNSVRGDYIIESVRTRFLQRPGGAPETTVTKGGVVAGAGADDGTVAIAAAAAGDFYYWVVPWTYSAAVPTPTTTDNQAGEALAAIRANELPAVGKESHMYMALSETVALGTAYAVDADANATRQSIAQAEDVDWPPSMIAAHVAGIVSAAQTTHPSANITGVLLDIPDPFDITDRPTTAEKKTALNNGLSIVEFSTTGACSLVRHITSRNNDGTNARKDYRCREGHITSAVDFFWSVVKQRWYEQKQPFVADNPTDGQAPTANTTTPGMVESMIKSVIDNLSASKPLGIYAGPILAPDRAAESKASVHATKVTGGITVQASVVAVEHLLKFEGKFFEIGSAY